MSEIEDAPRTVFAPSPGGRPGNARRPVSTPLGVAGVADTRFGVNDLVDAAGELLELAVYLRGQNSPLDTVALRAKILSLVTGFERRALAAGVEPKTAMRARYALCATLDDLILSKPWGFESEWKRNTLVSTLHEEVSGGDQFFELLDGVRRDPTRSQDLLELMYICLSLGFKGRYRRDAGGAVEVEKRRARLFQDVSALRGGLEDRLSVRWEGAETTRTALRDYIPVWLIGAGAAFLAALMFTGALWASYDVGGKAVAGTLEPAGPVRVVVPAMEEPIELPPPPIPEGPSVYDRLTSLFEDLIEDQVIDPLEVSGSSLRIRVRSVTPSGEVMFGSGKAEVNPYFRGVLTRIAEAIGEETVGTVTVEGHADNVPMRPVGPYFDNRRLSEARAGDAADVLWETLEGYGRQILFKGMGSDVNLDAGTSREANQRNRRIEILLPMQQVGEIVE